MSTMVSPVRVVTDADVLERAADLLENVGWCQNAAQTSVHGVTTGYCMWGAIGSVLYETRRSAGEAIQQLPGPMWNDEPDRTADEVIALLRDAAASLRAERSES